MSHNLDSLKYRLRYFNCIEKIAAATNNEKTAAFMKQIAVRHPEIFMRTVEDIYGATSSSSLLSENDRTILGMATNDHAIQAIKYRREKTGEGLREAKDYVVRLCERNGIDCGMKVFVD